MTNRMEGIVVVATGGLVVFVQNSGELFEGGTSSEQRPREEVRPRRSSDEGVRLGKDVKRFGRGGERRRKVACVLGFRKEADESVRLVEVEIDECRQGSLQRARVERAPLDEPKQGPELTLSSATLSLRSRTFSDAASAPSSPRPEPGVKLATNTSSP